MGALARAHFDGYATPQRSAGGTAPSRKTVSPFLLQVGRRPMGRDQKQKSPGTAEASRRSSKIASARRNKRQRGNAG
jgi:hypothetical protein